MKQIVINLVSNAIKYNKEQGTVVVDCAESAPGRIRISVRDTGAGLPPEKLAQLFTPFNRLGQEAGSVAGTGIGLVVSKRLAELMGGVIGVESTRRDGQRVLVRTASRLPRPSCDDQTGEAEISVHPAGVGDAPRRTLLYVEDNPANMQLVEQLIARFPDIGLLTAVNGTLGIELARAAQPQVILMDINLPGISGIKALKILRDRPGHGAHSRRCPERQCHATRHREGPGGGILPLSHQTHQDQRVHGHAERGPGIRRTSGPASRFDAGQRP